MSASVRLGRLAAWIISWVVGFLVGQWLVLQIPSARAFSGAPFGWRILAFAVAYVVLMYAIDVVWRSPSGTRGRSLAREFVDAAIVGALFGLTIAR